LGAQTDERRSTTWTFGARTSLLPLSAGCTVSSPGAARVGSQPGEDRLDRHAALAGRPHRARLDSHLLLVAVAIRHRSETVLPVPQGDPGPDPAGHLDFLPQVEEASGSLALEAPLGPLGRQEPERVYQTEVRLVVRTSVVCPTAAIAAMPTIVFPEPHGRTMTPLPPRADPETWNASTASRW